MPITEQSSTDILTGPGMVSLSQFFSVSGTVNPAYLVVTGLDRNEYTAADTGDTGSFSGNGNSLALTAAGDDARAAGIVFTWQASTLSYVSATYGSFGQLTYMASANPEDVTNLSLFTTSSAVEANAYANNPYGLIATDAAGYAGSATIVTNASVTASTSANATPDGIAMAAANFVGDAWNENGCWVLASTIAAVAGASLPVQSTEVDIQGKANGAWIVAYDGPVSVRANWVNLVATGDIITFVPQGGGGHVTTCVSGSGANAQLIDNITYLGPGGQVQNSADDGSSNDVTVAAAHPASQEFSGVNANTVVIYALDTPAVNFTSVNVNASVGTNLTLGGLLSVKDPAGKAVTCYAIYDSAGAALVSSTGTTAITTTNLGTSSSAAIDVRSLNGLSLAYSGAATDTVEISAFNGTYWGDWSSLVVNATIPVPKPPMLHGNTANQTWQQGTSDSLTLPATLFTDPQKEILTYSATQTDGSALPSWLHFNASTRNVSGVVPKGALLSVPVLVTATDTAGLSTSESFTINVPAAAPSITDKTTSETLTAGSQVSFSLPQDAFTDPQGEALTLKASLGSGAQLPGWLSFSPSNGSFSGTAPTSLAPVSVKVTAADSSNLAVSEIITLTIAAHAPVASGVIAQQSWSEGAQILLTAPGFSDPQGETLTVRAATASGGALPGWLSFNAGSETFSGTAPVTAQTLNLKLTATDASGLSASETFSAVIAAPKAGGFPLSTGQQTLPIGAYHWH